MSDCIFPAILGQQVYTITQSQQTSVNIGALLHLSAAVQSLYLLRPRQINNIQLWHCFLHVGFLNFHHYLEDCMRTWRILVGDCGCECPFGIACINDLVYLLDALYWYLVHIGHGGVTFVILNHIQESILLFLVCQQVTNILIVNLHEADFVSHSGWIFTP